MQNAKRAFALGDDASEDECSMALLIYKQRNIEYVEACMKGIHRADDASAHAYGDVAASAIAQQAQASMSGVYSDMPMDSADESEEERKQQFMDLRPHGVAPHKGFYDDGDGSHLTV